MDCLKQFCACAYSRHTWRWCNASTKNAYADESCSAPARQKISPYARLIADGRTGAAANQAADPCHPQNAIFLCGTTWHTLALGIAWWPGWAGLELRRGCIA